VTPVLGAGSSTLLWYLARGAGVTALVLLTISMILGVVTSVRWSSARWPRFVTQAVHRNVSLLAVVVIFLHIATVVIDGFAPIGWKDAFIPFLSGYRALWLGFGAIAFDLVLALTITSLLRHRIGARTWRVVHWLSYLCWPLVVIHGFGSGTDANLSPVLVTNVACVIAVVLAVWWRVANGWPDHLRERALGLTASIVAPAVLAVWLAGGPLAAGWARKAGTPDSLLGGGVSVAAGTPSGSGASGSGAAAPPTTTAPPATAGSQFASVPFDARLAGAVAQSQPSAAGRVTVRLSTTLSNGADGVLTVDITGRPTNDGGVVMDTSRVTLGPSNQPTLYDGQITNLQGTNIGAVVRSPAGTSIRLSIAVRIDQSTAKVTGTVRADAA
jgi:sulfoxide reductase heme-binding subunit YedZ